MEQLHQHDEDRANERLDSAETMTLQCAERETRLRERVAELEGVINPVLRQYDGPDPKPGHGYALFVAGKCHEELMEDLRKALAAPAAQDPSGIPTTEDAP